jgi:hypothetical protein
MRPVGNIFTDPIQKRFLQDISTAIEQASKDKAESSAGGYFKAVDRKQTGSHGGSSSPGQWQTRELNSVDANVGDFGSLSSGRVTLQPGTYEFLASVPACQSGKHQARLRAVEGGTVWMGTVEAADVDTESSSRSVVVGRVALKNRTTMVVQQIVEKEKAGSGLGLAGNFTDEIYTVVEFRRIGG